LQHVAEEMDQTDDWSEGKWEKLGDLAINGFTVDPEYGGDGAVLLWES